MTETVPRAKNQDQLVRTESNQDRYPALLPAATERERGGYFR